MRTNYAKILTLVQTLCCMAAAFGLCGHQETSAQDVDPYSQLVQDSERHTGPRWVPNYAKEGENVSVREGAPVNRYTKDDAERQSLWDAYDGTTLGVERDPYDVLEKESDTQEEGKVECDCGTACKCPPLVCKAGHCKSNYVAMFSATWCKPCRAMYPILKELRKEGYIVYIYTLDTDDFKDLNLDSKFQISAYPTFVVFDKGKETARGVGKMGKDQFYDWLIPEDEQEKPTPDTDSDVYDNL